MPQRIILRHESGGEHQVTISGSESATIGDRTLPARRIQTGELRVAERTVWTAAVDDTRWVFLDGNVYIFELQRPATARSRKREKHDESLSAPMPATVVKLHVAPGDAVKAGQLLIVLEAMKMELPVRSNIDARVEAVHCNEGELVQPGQPLIELTPRTNPESSQDDRR
jgi:biotin carboxyl carrier protein